MSKQTTTRTFRTDHYTTRAANFEQIRQWERLGWTVRQITELKDTSLLVIFEREDNE